MYIKTCRKWTLRLNKKRHKDLQEKERNAKISLNKMDLKPYRNRI